jgi:hypothetical protein
MREKNDLSNSYPSIIKETINHEYYPVDSEHHYVDSTFIHLMLNYIKSNRKYMLKSLLGFFQGGIVYFL